jgi:tetratricopeptide (TPR) repeat protein
MIATMTPEQRKVARRILAADGYLDLNMPGHALKELDRIDDAGAFEASVFYLRGCALKASGEFESAIPWLEEAARMIPAPLSRFAWKSLGECYREQGDSAMAELAQLAAETAEALGGDDFDFDDDDDDDNIIQPPDFRPHGRLENHPHQDETEK